jgi:hypothetical protein
MLAGMGPGRVAVPRDINDRKRFTHSSVPLCSLAFIPERPFQHLRLGIWADLQHVLICKLN